MYSVAYYRKKEFDLKELENFFTEIQNSESDLLSLVIEPGDSTRYELVVSRVSEDTLVISQFENRLCWKIYKSAVPYDFVESPFDHTRCLLADIANIILRAEVMLSYDWKKAYPLVFLNREREVTNA